MDYIKIRKLREKLYFTVEDLARVLEVAHPSARVIANRYTKKGIFIRLKNNFYVLEENWRNHSREDRLKVSNFLQVPSYLSFMTALSFYGVTTQVQRDFYESASLKRSRRFEPSGAVFLYYKLKKEHYSGFVKKNDIFIATKEKAFIDSVYLYSFGKYKLDLASLDLSKLDKAKIKKEMTAFPKKTKEMIVKLCKT